MRNIFALGLFTLLAACAVQQPSTPLAPQRAPVAHVAPEFVCRVGEEVPEPRVRPDTIRLSFFAVPQSLAVLPYVDRSIVGDYAVPLLQAVFRGEVQHWQGHGSLRIVLHAPNLAAMPREAAVIGGPNICRGMAPVRQVDRDVFAVDIPIEGGPMLSFAGIVLPRAALITPHERVWACVQASFPLAYVPKLTTGPYAGTPRLLCGLPGSAPGTTRLGQVAISGGAGEIFPLIAAAGG